MEHRAYSSVTGIESLTHLIQILTWIGPHKSFFRLVESKLRLTKIESGNMSQTCDPLFKWWFELVLAQETDKYPLKVLNNDFFNFSINLSEYPYFQSDCK